MKGLVLKYQQMRMRGPVKGRKASYGKIRNSGTCPNFQPPRTCTTKSFKRPYVASSGATELGDGSSESPGQGDASKLLAH